MPASPSRVAVTAIEPLPSSSSVKIGLNYSTFDGQGEAYYHVFEPTDGTPRTNVGETVVQCDVHDVRGHESAPQLDVHGFQFVYIPETTEPFESEASVAAGSYYRDIEELLRRHVGPFDQLVLFDNTTRRQTHAVEAPGARMPVPQVHVDQSRSAVERRVRLHIPDDAERILASGARLRVLNIWRPLIEGSPVYDKPLALADWRTVDTDRDFFLKKRIAPERVGETMGVRPNGDRHRWYYLSAQKTTEATLIKCFDSDSSKAVLTPHTAIVLPGPYPEGYKPRASCEVRALIMCVLPIGGRPLTPHSG